MKPKEKETKQTFAEFVKEVNEDFEEGMIVTEPIKIDSISTGSFSLDRALGIGGLPKGRIVEIFGLESSGKTSLALSVIAQVQKAGGRAGYIDAEQALDPNFAKILGVKFEDVVLSQPKIAEDALKLMLKMMESGLFQIIVLDSTAAILPRSEMEGEIGDNSIAVKARLMKQAMRKMDDACAKTNTLVIFINHITYKIGGFPGSNPETTPGGGAVKFAASVRIGVRRKGILKDSNDNPIGIEIKAKVVKNKVAAPYKEAIYHIYFDKGISVGADIFNTALKEKIIIKEGNTYYLGSESKKEKIGVGQQKCYTEIENNEELKNKIIEKLKI